MAKKQAFSELNVVSVRDSQPRNRPKKTVKNVVAQPKATLNNTMKSYSPISGNPVPEWPSPTRTSSMNDVPSSSMEKLARIETDDNSK